MTMRPALALVIAGLAGVPAVAQEKLDWATLGRIRDEGFRHSQVMETAAQLTDVYDPRLTGSPQYRKAAEWARQQLEAWGLANAHLESWPFGRGWSFEACSARVVAPTAFPLVALPKAWTAGTSGPVRGRVIRVKVDSEADVEALKGKVAGMVLWVGQPRELKGPEEGGVFKRYTDHQHEEDANGYNVVADLPGPDRKGELVMVGAHLDSWHSGTGATDDAAGSAVMMEAMRILKAIDAKPRRTVRIGLWGGEEQGFLGSRAYVSEHFASRPEPKEPGPDELPSYMRNEPPAPMTLKAEHAKLSAYFNLDNGTGRIRGIYLQENEAVRPIFEAWMESVKDLGATRVTMNTTGGTDHLPFDGVGLPGFQFIHDPIEYADGAFFGTHHTNMDVYDRLQREDLMQAAVVIATFAYNAATRDDLLPRKPLPPTVPAAPAARAGTKGGTRPAPKAVEAAPGRR